MGSDLKVTLSLIDNFTQKITGVQSKLGAFGAQIDNINKVAMRFGVGFGAYFGVNAVVDGIKDLVKTSQEYTQTQNQIREALGYTSIELDKQAGALREKYVLDDRDIKKVQLRLSLYTQDEGMIKRLTEATINYALATGKDLLTATNLVDRAIISENGSMKGLPGKLDGAAESSERLAAIVDGLNQKMHGQAQAVADSKNLWDKLKISIAEVKRTIAVGVFGKGTEREMLRYKQALDFTEKYYDLNAAQQKKFRAEYEQDIAFIAGCEKKIGDEKIKAQHDTQERLSADAAKKINLTPGYENEKKYAEEMKKQSEQRRKDQEESDLYDAEKFSNAFAEENDLRNQLHDIEEKRIEKTTSLRLSAQEEIKKESWDALSVSAGHNVENYNSLKSTYQQEIDAANEKYDEMERAGANYAMAEAARTKALDAIKVRSYSGWATQAISSFQTIGTAAHASTQLMKRLSEAEALINTYVSITKTMTAVPYPFNIPLAVLQGAAGLAQVANIEAQSFSMGTPSAPGGAAYVHKDESIYLPQGAAVKTASETRQTVNNAGHTFNVSIVDVSGQLVDTVTAHIRDGATGTDRLLKTLAAKLGV
jgi:hypothetical protein